MISEQMRLRRRVAALKARQELRITMVQKKKDDMDALIEREQRTIDNLESRLTVGVAR